MLSIYQGLIIIVVGFLAYWFVVKPDPKPRADKEDEMIKLIKQLAELMQMALAEEDTQMEFDKTGPPRVEDSHDIDQKRAERLAKLRAPSVEGSQDNDDDRLITS